ncbi:MAG: adenylate/guanylate cyclase domain-containing protein [Gammaproteobacteria bacterium]|nr:adenylate/guanylate cyclase domain-containing protein [Gammaproteobacteria bacterium]
MDERLPRKLAAILYADVAGYSRLTGDDEDATHRTLSEYLNLISQTIDTHRGKVMHYAGDAVLAKFEAVVDALSSAKNIQQLLATQNETLPEERRVYFRIGINLGDIIEDRGDIYGDGVNVAARLESLADSGGICISDAVRSAVKKKLDLDYEDMGDQALKNIDEPVHAFRVKGFKAGVADTSTNRPRQGKSTEKPSIGVLRFQNLSKEGDDDFFVAGITEEIMSGLSRYREIVVAALGSSLLVSEQKLDATEAAKKLGVQYILNGSVRRAGDRVRVLASLVEGSSGHQIWSEQYDHVLDDIFEVQDEVAQKIVTMLSGKIEQSDRERSLHKDTDNLTAYECMLRGRYYFGDWHGSEDDVRQAREMFEKAIELDPRYAAAYAGLAAAYLEDFDHSWWENPEDSGNKCLELAQKSIELDEDDSFAHLVLSAAYWKVKSNFDLAKRQLEAAIQLNPNYYWNYCYGCWFTACYGDMETSILQAKEAIRRNPLLPDGCRYTLGFSEYLAGNYENAINTITQIAKLEPESYACLAASYAQLGRVEEARRVAEDCVEHTAECTKSVSGWREYWASCLNFREQGPVDHLIEGLDKAGLVKH